MAGAIARALIPNDAFRHMHGIRSWLTSLELGGALDGAADADAVWQATVDATLAGLRPAHKPHPVKDASSP